MVKTEKFQCLRCSTCCRNLLENKNGILRGLPLTEKETEFFPKEYVAPKVALGREKPENVILFQLIMGKCPKLSDRNECTIYLQRPLMCRSFPIVAGAVSNRCRIFSYRKPGLTYDEPYSMEEQLEASNKFEKYLQSRLSKKCKCAQRIWEYNLETKTWVSTE